MTRLWLLALLVSVFATPCYLEITATDSIFLLAVFLLHVGFLSICCKIPNTTGAKAVSCIFMTLPFWFLDGLLTLFWLYQEIGRLF